MSVAALLNRRYNSRCADGLLLRSRSAELSAWDFETLEEELAKLNLDGIDMDDLGFDFDQGELFDYMANDPFTESQAEHDTFVMSFEFPIDKKEQLEKYVKENGKKAIVDGIVERITEVL